MAAVAMSGEAEASGPVPASQKPKLTGRAFYESIGSPRVVLAPMVDQSEFAWRVLTRSFLKPDASGRLLAYSPMFHARLFGETQQFRDKHFQPVRPKKPTDQSEGSQEPKGQPYLDGRFDVDRPLTVQFCSNNPDEFLEAAKHVQGYCDAVDLNLGCPQRIAKNGRYGAFLQEDRDLVYKLINALHKEVDVPVTAKIRILETKEQTLEYAKTVLAAGASILTVHGRRREQKGHYTGLADWSFIRYLRDNLPLETVLFANGNILRHDDIERCLEATGADAVMSAEGNLHDPSIFSPPPPPSDHDRSYWRSPKTGKGGYRIDFVLRRYLSILYKFVLEEPEPERQPLFILSDRESKEPTIINPHHSQEDGPPRKKRKGGKNQQGSSASLRAVQSHLFSFMRPLITTNTHVRDAVAKARPGDMAALEYVLALTEQVTRRGIQEFEDNPQKFEDLDEPVTEEAAEDIADHESSVRAVKACRRPWWVCQSHVRPVPKEAIEKGGIMLSKKEMKKLETQAEQEAEAAKAFGLQTDDPIAKAVAGVSEKGSTESRSQLPAPASVCG